MKAIFTLSPTMGYRQLNIMYKLLHAKGLVIYYSVIKTGESNSLISNMSANNDLIHVISALFFSSYLQTTFPWNIAFVQAALSL